MLTHTGITLFVNYYKSDKKPRQKEIDFCLLKNLDGPVDAVVSIGEPVPFEHTKLRTVIALGSTPRPTFQDHIDFCNEHYQGEICMISNIDITFDESILSLRGIDLTNKFLCLTRWEHDSVGDWAAELKRLPCPPSGTQDTWIFVPPIPLRDANFTMGVMGCDHKIAMLAKWAKMETYNPCRSIICKHWHDSAYRTYNPSVGLGVYSPTHPCFIEDMK